MALLVTRGPWGLRAPLQAPLSTPQAPFLQSPRPVRRVSTSASVSAAPSRKTPRQENVPGDFFVDHTCIDCDTCRWMAPSVFSRANGMSAVHHQPDNPEERLQALQALLSCPTASIHTRQPPSDMKAAQNSFPLHISPDLPGVYHCGFHSDKSFGAASYYVQAPGCNVLVDSPRFTEVLASRIEALGGVDYMFLTHKDDVADHDKWAKRFGCKRIIHRSEVTRGTVGVEVQLEGEGPWDLPLPDDGAEPAQIGSSRLQILFTPGHTSGHCCLLLRPSEDSAGVLFSGDHLAAGRDGGSKVRIFRDFNWYSVELQEHSVRGLKDYPFQWVLPGHGRRMKFPDEVTRKEALQHFSSG